MSLYLQDNLDKTFLMSALMDLPKAPYIEKAHNDFDPNDAVAVEMHDGAVTLPNAEYPALGTVALVSCVGVIAHNPHSKATGLVHVVPFGTGGIPSPESETSLEQMLTSVKGGMETQIEVRLAGSSARGEMQERLLLNIMDILSEYNSVILSADVRGKASPRDIAVDSRQWDKGLVRGGVDMVDFLNDPKTGGVVEMVRQKNASFNLYDMNFLPIKSHGLVYDATKPDDLTPQPEI